MFIFLRSQAFKKYIILGNIGHFIHFEVNGRVIFMELVINPHLAPSMDAPTLRTPQPTPRSSTRLSLKSSKVDVIV